MDVHEELLENRAQIKMLEAKLESLLSILEREGMIERDEFEETLDEQLTHSKKKE